MVDYRIRVIVDPVNAEKGVRRVNKALDKTANKADKLRSTMARMFAIAGGVAIFSRSVRLLADYGQAMSTVQAVAKATNEEFKQLSKTAQDLGISTRFSASQAAEGMVFLARSGLKVNEVLGAIESTLRLAQAGALDLASASKITAEVMRGFRLDVSDVERIVDVFALTAASANTDVAQLGLGMKFVGAIATGLNVSLETTTAAMASLSDAGLQATMAGTGLRRILAELESPSNRTKQILDSVGLSIDDVKVSSVGLVEALTKLKQAGVETGEGLEIFGQRGGPAFEVLSNSIPKIEAMEFMLKRAAGTAKEMATVMDKNLKGALLALRSAWEGIILKVGDAGTESGSFTQIIRGLTVALRALADNIEFVTTVLTGLLTVGLLLLARKVIPFLIGKIILLGTTVKTVTATTALGLRTVATEVEVFSARLALLKIKAFILNPMVLLTVAITGSVIALQKFNKVLEETNQAYKDAEKGSLTAFGKVGDRILRMQERIKRLQNDIAKNPYTSQSQVKMLEKLRGQLAELRDESDKFKKSFEETVATQNRSNKVFKDINKSLSQEALFLKQSSNERRIQKELYSALNKLQEANLDLSETEVTGLEDKIRANQLLRDQVEILDKLQGPQEEFNRKTAALEELFKTGKITAGEYREVLDQITDTLLGPVPEDPFGETVSSLQDQIKVLEETAVKGEAAGNALAEQLRLAKEGVNLTPEQQKQLEILHARIALLEKEKDIAIEIAKSDPFGKQVTSLENANAQLSTFITKGSVAADALKIKQGLAGQGVSITPEQEGQLPELIRENKLLAEQARIIKSVNGSQEQLAITMKALNQLRLDGLITQEQYNQKMREARMATDQASTSLGAGFSRGLERIKDEITDVGGALEDSLVGAFHSAQEALLEFVRTGEFNFQKFATAIIDEITRIILRLLILKAIEAITGESSGGGGLTGLITEPKAEGGTVGANRPYLVGEQGPELFIPPGMGNIVPADETATRMKEGGGGGSTVVNTPPPEVNVNVVNVSDPSEVPASMDSPAGDRVILNSISRQKNQTKRLIT